jgi:hypothetical protein
MKSVVVRTAVATLVLALAACKPAPIDPEHVAAKINRGLPQPYAKELVFQHAHAEGRRLVMDIRIPFATVAKLDPKKLPIMRNQEQGDLNIAVCQDPDLEALMKDHYDVSRRFIDRNGKTVFELVAMKAPTCKLFQ